MKYSVLKVLLPLTLIFFAGISCDTTDPFSLPDPDFSTVPEPFDYSSAEAEEIEEGITVYVLEEGSGQFSVDARDQISVHVTLRTMDGEIIYSTYNDGRTDPVAVTVGNIALNPNVFQYSISLAYTEGFKKGLLGMKQGEKRTVIVSPEKGFGDLPEGAVNSQHRDQTLQYDIRVSQIAM